MKPTLLNAIQQRYACREFMADQPVSADQLAVILEAGRLAPSAFGLEPWRFITVADPATLTHACFDQPAVTTAAALIVIVALVDELNPGSAYVRARFEAEARDGDTAPIYEAYRALYHPDLITAWSQGQCHFAASHMLLQAAHMGLGSCPIGGFDPVALTAVLHLPASEAPALIIALGRCKIPVPSRKRKPLDR